MNAGNAGFSHDDPKRRLSYSDSSFERLTHYLFRFPAKFHPPVVKALIEEYSGPGDHILDPFCGSGSMLVEAAIAGRPAVGSDLDPVAAFISRVKTHRYNPERLSRSASVLASELAAHRRPEKEYIERRFRDIGAEELSKAVAEEDLWVPDIPNIFHWFRKYVILDLARIHWSIDQTRMPTTHKDFFLLCFASIIRASSNADPVPVSGLEVTSYMKRREEEGRTIDPFGLFDRTVKNSLAAVGDFNRRMDRKARARVIQADARELARRCRQPFDAIITSPPYHNAVDYYRRHKLEMFWLGFTKTQEQRLELMRGYVGRGSVARRDAYPDGDHPLGTLASYWESKMRVVSPMRAGAFRHYAVSMKLVFDQLAKVLKDERPLVMVVGNSKWNGAEIPSLELFSELAEPQFKLIDHLWYPIKNRYMSYSRRNGANIDREHVLVMHKTVS